MFKPFISISACLFSILSAQATDVIMKDSVSMGAKYANDVYVDVDGGTQKEVSRTNWDIAFTTKIRGAAIMANNGNGVEVMIYPKSKKDGFHTVDTTGCSKWPRLYNSETSAELGAFNVTTTDKSQMDYGWGVYNMTSHNVVGDSIFLIKTAAGMKKLVILQKVSVENRIEFYYSNLDNSDSTFVNLKANDYPNRNFVYYSVDNKQMIDREMDADKWDLLFTKYTAYIPAGPGVFQWYPVIGVQLNSTTKAIYHHAANLNRDTYETFNNADFSSNQNTLGWEWKVLDNNTYKYSVPDTNVYFIKTAANNVYKFYFTAYAGSSTGKVSFERKKLITTALTDSKSKKLRVYPTPASSYLTVETEVGKVEVSLYSIKGTKVYETQENGGIFSVDVNNLTNGVYVLKLETATGTQVKQITVNR